MSQFNFQPDPDEYFQEAGYLASPDEKSGYKVGFSDGFQEALRLVEEESRKVSTSYGNPRDTSGLNYCKVCSDTSYGCKCGLPLRMLPEELEKKMIAYKELRGLTFKLEDMRSLIHR